MKRGRKSVRVGRGSAAVTGYDTSKATLLVRRSLGEVGSGGRRGSRTEAGSQKTFLFMLISDDPEVIVLLRIGKEDGGCSTIEAFKLLLREFGGFCVYVQDFYRFGRFSFLNHLFACSRGGHAAQTDCEPCPQL